MVDWHEAFAVPVATHDLVWPHPETGEIKGATVRGHQPRSSTHCAADLRRAIPGLLTKLKSRDGEAVAVDAICFVSVSGISQWFKRDSATHRPAKRLTPTRTSGPTQKIRPEAQSVWSLALRLRTNRGQGGPCRGENPFRLWVRW